MKAMYIQKLNYVVSQKLFTGTVLTIYELKPFSEAEKKSDNFMTFELEMEVFTSITLWLFEFMELSLYVF